MAAQSTTNWEPFEEEIIKFYVNQNHTLEETQTHMKSLGFTASINQYKKKYSGYKNLKLPEWAGVRKVYTERSQQGKASELWVHGRKMDPAKVTSQLARYQDKFGTIEDLSTASLAPRLSVNTPPSSNAITMVNDPPTSSTNMPAIELLDLSQLASLGERAAANTQPETGVHLSPVAHLHAIDGLQTGTQSRPPGEGIVASPSPSPSRVADTIAEYLPMDADGSMNININDWMIPELDASDDWLNFDYGLFGGPVGTRLKLLADLPWFNLQRALCERQTRSNDQLSTNTSSALVKLSIADRQAVLAGLLGPSTPGFDLAAVSRLSSQLSRVFPEQLDGETTTAVREFLAPTSKDPLDHLFKFASYFFSNNILTSDQKLAFLKWVVEKNYTEKLVSFLFIPATGVDAFRHGVIATVMQMEDLDLVVLMVRGGIPFDEILAQSTGWVSSKFFGSLLRRGLELGVLRQLSGSIGTLILRRALRELDQTLNMQLLGVIISPELLSGQAGGRLLQFAAKNGHLEVTRFLIRRGCEVNYRTVEEGHNETPLCHAVSGGHLEVVECLVSIRADLNKGSGPRFSDTALTLAVKQGRKDIVSVLVKGGASLDRTINGHGILEWSTQNNKRIYNHLCRLTGKLGPEKPKLTADVIVREADRGFDAFDSFFKVHRAELTDTLLEEALIFAVNSQKLRATSALLLAGVDPDTPKASARDNEPAVYLAAFLAVSDNDNYSDEPENDILQHLLDAGANPNIDKLVQDMVVIIEDGGGFEAFEMLINAGLDLQKYGPELLVDAIINGITDMIMFLIDKGVSPNSWGKPQTGLSALQAAANQGRIDLIEFFINHGGDINAPASKFNGRTALQAACQGGHQNVVQYLMEKGVDINAPPAGKDGRTALEASLSTIFTSTKIFDFLLKHGARLDRTSLQSGYILRRLIEYEAFDGISTVLKAGADVNHMWTYQGSYYTEPSRTALQLAAEQAGLDLVKLLLSHGGDINRPAGRKLGRTALQAAASRTEPEPEIVQYLIDHNANINAPPAADGGVTALQGACIQGHIKIVLLLLEQGANTNAPPALKDGRTALEAAAEHGRLDVAKMLLNAGAKPNWWSDSVRWNTHDYKREISLAETNRHFTVAELLRSHQRLHAEEEG